MSPRISVGTDLVHVPGFAEQLARPGSVFEQVFSPLELRVAATKGARRAEHLAGRWAAKEAYLKAWSQARYGQPPVMVEHDVRWEEIETRPDAWGRVEILLHGAIAGAVSQTLGKWKASVSISHDGDYATATVLLSY